MSDLPFATLDTRAALAVERSSLISQVYDLAAAQGLTIYLAGGSVRDLVLGKETHDLDFAVAGDGLALARHVADRLHGAYVAMDRERKTGRVLLPTSGEARPYLDFASLRGESLEADLHGRDFTMNAMALERTPDGHWQLCDPLGGQHDLANGILRATSPSSFTDDPVRTMRAVRMCTQFQCMVEPQTQDWLRSAAPLLSRASAERVRDEWFKILARPGAADALRKLHELGLLPAIVPQAAGLDGLRQDPADRADVLAHALASVRAVERLWTALEDPDQHTVYIPQALYALVPQLRRRYQAPICDERTHLAMLKCAAFLHDIGKARVRPTCADGQVCFAGYEQAGAAIAAQLGRAWRCSNAECAFLRTAIAAHTRPIWLAAQPTGPRGGSRRAIYRFFRDNGAYGVDAAFVALADSLATADSLDAAGNSAWENKWKDLVKWVSRLLVAYYRHREQVIDPPLLLSGDDLMARFGLSPGPQIGRLLSRLHEEQAIGQIHTADQALTRVQTWIQEGKEWRW